MTQQQWGQPSSWGGQPGQQPGGWNPSGGGQPYPPPGYGQQPNTIQAQPYGGYGPGQFAPPRAPKKSPLRGLLLAVVALAAIALVGLVVTNLTTSSPDVAYQNDDYTVPPPDSSPPALPVPKTYGEAETVLTDNKFYAQTTPIPVRCGASPINVATADDGELKKHFESLMECLVRVWQPPVEGAGYQVVRPTVTIYGKTVTTQCGDAEVNAFYCSADQQVYFSNQLAEFVPIVKSDKWAADVVMAHEFGHALQARTAILISAHALGQESGDEKTDLEYSRRLEVQADCFSGMFIRSVSVSLGIKQADVSGIQETYRAVGDDIVSGKPNIVGNHGLAKSRVFWGSTGLGTSEIGMCNSFKASASQVR